MCVASPLTVCTTSSPRATAASTVVVVGDVVGRAADSSGGVAADPGADADAALVSVANGGADVDEAVDAVDGGADGGGRRNSEPVRRSSADGSAPREGDVPAAAADGASASGGTAAVAPLSPRNGDAAISKFARRVARAACSESRVSRALATPDTDDTHAWHVAAKPARAHHPPLQRASVLQLASELS